MVVRRNLIELDRILILERSHFDDILFFREHVQSGFVTEQQCSSHENLASILNGLLPVPDVMALMNPSPQISLLRLAKSEEAGDRSREFPSEKINKAWVERWYKMYVELHNEFRQRAKSDPSWKKVSLGYLEKLLISFARVRFRPVAAMLLTAWHQLTLVFFEVPISRN